MALRDLFNKKTKSQKRLEEKGGKEMKKAQAEKKEVVKNAKSAPEEKKVVSQTAKPKKGDVKIAPRVLRSPQITEKASFLQEKDQYVFKVFKTATKPEIKKSIEEVYGVNVEKVRVINVPRKAKRLGRSKGWQQGYKKAIITIKKGQSIEVSPR